VWWTCDFSWDDFNTAYVGGVIYNPTSGSAYISSASRASITTDGKGIRHITVSGHSVIDGKAVPLSCAEPFDLMVCSDNAPSGGAYISHAILTVEAITPGCDLVSYTDVDSLPLEENFLRALW
jgi:hypothetical protein